MSAAVHKNPVHFVAGIGRKVTTVTTTYTALATDDIILAAGAAPFTITLPTAASCWNAATSTSKELTIVNIDTDDCTIDGAGSETINGSATFVLDVQYQRVVLITNGTAWFVRDAVAALAANSVDSANYVDGSIDIEHMSAASVGPVALSHTSVAPAANAACAILATTTEILLTITDATNTAISTSAAEPGQDIVLRVAAAAGGGSYTLAVTTGTLTLNSVGETAHIRRNVADSAWFVVALTAGNAGGAAATIV